MTKNEQVVVLKVNNHKKLQVLQSLANKVTNEIDQVIRGFLFYNINYKGYKFKREVPLNVANSHRLHLNLRAMTKASKKYEFLNEVNKEKIEHQIETHSPSVWVQSEGVSLITDLSLSKKT